jgi:hypothetical protein
MLHVVIWASSVADFRDVDIGVRVTAAHFLLQETEPSYSDRQTAYTRKDRCHRNVQTDSGAHPASYSMGTEDFFITGKTAVAWHWPLISQQAPEVKNEWGYISTPPYAII